MGGIVAFGFRFFVFLGIMAWSQFTKTAKLPGGIVLLGEKKKKRNFWYRVCALIIWGSIGLLGLIYLVKGDLDDLPPIFGIPFIFLVETVAMWAFGFSKLVKGETIWKDPTP